mgnify:CR=1 FL=1
MTTGITTITNVNIFVTMLYSAIANPLLYVANMPSIPIVGKRKNGTGENSFRASVKSSFLSE